MAVEKSVFVEVLQVPAQDVDGRHSVDQVLLPPQVAPSPDLVLDGLYLRLRVLRRPGFVHEREAQVGYLGVFRGDFLHEVVDEVDDVLPGRGGTSFSWDSTT